MEAQAAGDGLVNVTASINGQQVGVMQNVNLPNAVSLAAATCPTSMIDPPALTNLYTNGTPLANQCNGLTGLSFVFSQNTQAGNGNGNGNGGNQGRSEYAPGQNRNTATTPPSATAPSTPPGQVGR